jgi:hypothetical protein
MLRRVTYVASALVAVFGITPAGTPVVAPPVSDHPAFLPGELAIYDVRYGRLHVGEATLGVVEVDTIRGHAAFHFRLTVSARVNLLVYRYTLHDTLESWSDTSTLVSFQYTQRQWHKGKLRSKQYEIFPERQTFVDGDQPEQPSVAAPMDDLGFLFLARRTRLEPANPINVARHFKPGTNPVVLAAVREDSLEAAGRRWGAVVVQPQIKTSTMFADGRGLVWIATDSTRAIIQLQASLPIGSVTMRLKSYRSQGESTRRPQNER